MPAFVIDGARVASVLGYQTNWTIVVDGPVVKGIGAPAGTVAVPDGAKVINGEGLTLLPGFVDVHIHGGGGADTMDATPEALRTICRTHAKHGTTGLLATTITQSREKISAALANARAAYEAGAEFCPDGARVLGIHLEGPYISPKKPGAQPKEYVRPYDPAEFDEWLEIAGDALKLITLAPEVPGAEALIRRCREAGIIVSLGHSDATSEEIRAAIASGVTHATHLFNAMPPIHHRSPGPIPVMLMDNRMRGVEVIADGHHVAPEAATMAIQTRGIERMVLITDAMSGAGAPDGLYELGGHPVTVANGLATLSDGTLAGSVLTMDRAIANVATWLGWNKIPWTDAVRLTSRNAAGELGLPSPGRIEPGSPADFVLVDETWNVHATIVAGRVVYRRA